MKKKLRLFVCSNLAPEANQILKNGDYPDVVLKSYPSRCTNCSINNQQIDLLTKDSEKYHKTLFLASVCYGIAQKEIPHSRNVEILHLEQCFEVFLNRETINYYNKQGYYLISSGWLKNYQRKIKDWGFDEQTAKVYFKESIQSILYLDSNLSWDYHPNLEKISAYMGLPYVVLPVGLSHFRNLIDSKVMEWRLEHERINQNKAFAKLNRENADFQFVFSQLQRLVDFRSEELIIAEMFELLNILFAPSQILYHRFEDKTETEVLPFYTEKGIPQQESSDVLTIPIDHQNETFGILEIFEIKFPEYLDQYRNLKPLITKICGVSISNARKYQIIHQQAEKLQEYAGKLKDINQSKDKFFSIIAHDLRGSLSSLMGLTELVSDQKLEMSEEDRLEMSQVIKTSSLSIYHLLEDLLEWSKMQRGLITYDPDTLLLSGIITDVHNQIKDAAKQKNIEIRIEIPNDCAVFADNFMVQTILKHLLSNAIKYTHQGGVIIVSSVKTQEETILTSVKDNGIGMTPSMIENLFKLDINTNRSGTNGESSTGLGIILCKDFVKRNGGRIWIESQEGLGTTVSFSLPIAESMG